MYQYLLLLETQKEKDFFQEIYKCHKNEMYAVAFKILQNRLDSEDMVHETFVIVIHKLHEMMKEPPEKNWNFILTILKNKCINLCKKKKWETDRDLEGQLADEIFADGLDAKLVELEEKESILELLKGMYKPYQDVLLLQYYHQLKIAEIAELLGKSPDNVRHMSKRAKDKLQRKLEERRFQE